VTSEFIEKVDYFSQQNCEPRWIKTLCENDGNNHFSNPSDALCLQSKSLQKAFTILGHYSDALGLRLERLNWNV